jgi:hypothetical protein
MAVTKVTTGTGEITTDFLLNDYTVYFMNTSATGGYSASDWTILGYTSAEKTMNHINEKYNREDKIPRITTYTKTIRTGLEIQADLSNQNAQIEGIIKQGTINSETGSNTGTRVAYGTDQGSIEYRAVRFVGVRDDSVTHTITIPKCEMTLNGEKTLGGETEVVTPIMFKAVYNPSANATANMFYENFLDSGVSATGDVPTGYS